MIEVRFTADRVAATPDTEEGLATESGWIVPSWSMRQIVDDPEMIIPEVFDTREEALARIEEVIGSVENEERGTFYASDAVIDFQTGDSWHYAGHITEV